MSARSGSPEPLAGEMSSIEAPSPFFPIKEVVRWGWRSRFLPQGFLNLVFLGAWMSDFILRLAE